MPSPRRASRPLILRRVGEPCRDQDIRLAQAYDLLLRAASLSRRDQPPKGPLSATESPVDLSLSYTEVLS